MASDPKTQPNKVSAGLAANRPGGILTAIPATENTVSFGDEYYATDTGEYSKCTSTATGTKQWTTVINGNGISRGTGTTNGSTLTIADTGVTATSSIMLTRTGTSATALGELSVVSRVVGTSFTVAPLNPANGATLATDTGNTFAYVRIG